MRSIMGSFLLVGFVAASADGADRRDQLFVSWQQTQRGVKTLVVQFTLETRDLTFDERESVEGTFRLIRNPQGEIFASYELAQPKAKGDKQQRYRGLLNHEMVYLLDHDKKIAIRFHPSDGDLRRFLEEHFNPFVLLLDQKRACEKCQIEVVKQDEWYTYLAVKPKQVKRFGWFPDSFHEGRVVLVNKASEGVPRHMPRQLWYTDGVREYTFEIKKWLLNAADGPKLEEFAKPESRPGWRVCEWLLRVRK